MNYINNGKYYLVKQNEEETKIIKINEKWFLPNGNDILREGNDISSIDLVTSKFNNMDELKTRMIKNGYINETDKLFIVSSHKFNNKEYISEFDFVFKSKHTAFLNELAYQRLNSGEIDKEMSQKFMYEFITKLFTDDTFYEFMTSSFNKIENNFIEMILSHKNKYSDYSNSCYSIIYKLGDRLKSYAFIRNIIATWNSYDELIKKYDKGDAKKLINEYINNKDNNKKNTEEIRKKIDKNNIEGQMTMDDWLKEIDEKNYKKKKQISIKEMFKENPNANRNSDDDPFKEIHELEKEAMADDFDSPILRDLKNKGIDEFDLVSHIPRAEIQKLSDKDRYKLGMIDIITYKNSVYNNGKKYN